MSRILVVDDEPAIVAGIQSLLELHDIESEGAWDCESAEERISAEFFPIILADLRMRSDEDGFRLLDAVKRISPNSRVATMTAYADAATEARLRDRGSELILHKPFEEDELMAALREMLAAIEAAASAHVSDSELYEATLSTLESISRGRYHFTKDEAEELVQDTWVLFLEKRASVRAPKEWLTGTLRNLCRQEIDRRCRDRQRVPEIVPETFTPADDEVLAVRQALERLDPRSRELCTLIGLEQRSYEEVVATAGIPIGSVGPLYMRAKQRLRKAMDN
ncbi:MAG TPA: response regulator [Thermoanaerobaculia bacterium]